MILIFDSLRAPEVAVEEIEKEFNSKGKRLK